MRDDDIRRVGDLEIGQDLAFERRDGRLQRAGWLVILLVLAASTSGLCGSVGPLGSVTARAAEGSVEITYARFPRHNAPMVLEVRLPATAITDGRARIWLDGSYLDRFNVQSTQPDPATVEAAGERVIYTFQVAAGAEPVTVSLSLTPLQYGRQTGRIGLVDGPSWRLRQFVYP